MHYIKGYCHFIRIGKIRNTGIVIYVKNKRKQFIKEIVIDVD